MGWIFQNLPLRAKGDKVKRLIGILYRPSYVYAPHDGTTANNIQRYRLSQSASEWYPAVGPETQKWGVTQFIALAT